MQEAVKNFTGNEPFKGINPDECVAMGAALQAGVLTGDVKGLLLLDVTPLSLGIETMGGVCTRLIERNTTIPVKKSQIFSTRRRQPDQRGGQRPSRASGRWPPPTRAWAASTWTASPRPAAACLQIEVTFDIDANGIVNVLRQGLGHRQGASTSPSPPPPT